MNGRPKKLTILQVVPALRSGGVERGVLEVAGAIVAAGHRSLVVSAGGPMVDALVAGGSEHFECPLGRKSPTTLRWIPWLRRLLIDQRVDLIDYHSRLPGWIAFAAWRLLPANRRPKLVSSLHGLHSVNAYSRIMCRGEQVVAVSETVRDYIKINYRSTPLDRVKVIHRGIDDREFPRGFVASRDWREKFFKTSPAVTDAPLLTLAGRLTRLKGHHDFIDLIDRLRRRGTEVHGLIVGAVADNKHAYVDELRAKIAEFDLQRHVTFTGGRSDMREIYSISTLVLSLSRTPESFGRTVAEALSVGTPVVGYAHGGVAEILKAQFPQGSVPLGSLDELEQRVLELLASEPMPVPAANPFSVDDMLSKTLDLYTTACGTPAGSASDLAFTCEGEPV